MGVAFRVKLFAHLKDGRGPEVEIVSEPRSEALLTALEAAGIPVKGCRLAVNHEFVISDCSLQQSDAIALIPPVSGG